MSIDHEVEALIPFNEARSAFPGRNNIALQTLHRWRLRGVRGVKLETVLVGGLRYTSREAINRFISAQNAGETPTPTFTPHQRRRLAETADQLCKAKGF